MTKGTLLVCGAALALCSWLVVASGSGPRLTYEVGDLVRAEIVADRIRAEAPRRTVAR